MPVQFTSYLVDVEAALEQEAKRRTLAAANLVRTQVLLKLSGGRSGRTYRVPGTKRTYSASAPGEAPASVLGDLRRAYQVAELDAPQLGHAVGAATAETDREGNSVGARALHLERGTRRMAARPHLQPAFEEVKDEIEGIFTERWF
jgi:hypothetical protein